MSDDFDDIQAIFFEECAEGLATAEAGLSAMREGDVSAEVIASIFRAVHSIKGGAGAFGHGNLTAFAHIFENVLDEVRAGRITPTPGVVGAMLTAFDILLDHVGAARNAAPSPADGAALEALENILAGQGAEPMAEAAPPPSHIMVEASAAPEEDAFGFTPVAVSLDDFDAPGASAGEAAWMVTFRPSRAALANAGEPLLVLRELEGLGGEVIAVDTDALPRLGELDPEDAYLTWTMRVPGYVAEVDILDCFDFVAPDSFIDIARAAPENAVPQDDADEMGFVPVEAVLEDFALEPVAQAAAPAPAPAPRAPVKAAADVAQTVRVDLGKLDLLLNLVGELVIRNSILADRLSPADRQRVELPELARLTRQIQDNVMSLRAQPMRHAFGRVPRLLRDLSAETGKLIRLEVHGEMTEVDKGVIEKIGDPLTHMIRNAADHGLESPEERLAAGKPAEGMIRLSAEQRGARIFVQVADDGRGIDRVRVRAKAIERGIIAADAQLSNEEIDQLVCAPGFSTAERVSNISGRGVGMDVVRANVEALGGRVEIYSVPGEGTAFTMALPLTLAILDGMIVRLADQRFVLPLAHVLETVQPEAGQVKRISRTCEVIDMRGEYVPLRRVHDIFGLHDEGASEDPIVVIVESESSGKMGLVVDRIDDRREVVIKSLEQNLHPVPGLGGATILGDGSIALILDIDALVTLPRRHLPKRVAA